MTTQTIASLSAAYKDAFGFRPSSYHWERWATMTDAELDVEKSRLSQGLDWYGYHYGFSPSRGAVL